MGGGKKSILMARLLAADPDGEKYHASSESASRTNTELPFRSRKRRRGARQAVKTDPEVARVKTDPEVVRVKTDPEVVRVKTDPEVVSAVDAALEKIKAGEKRNVEHVALADEHTHALHLRHKQQRRKSRRRISTRNK